MCIAIVKTPGSVISDQALSNSFNNNPDGAGIAYAQGGELYYIKGIFDEKEFIEQVRNVEAIAEGSILIHCRIGTSGLKDKDNCHPHIVNSKTVMIHNGILDLEVPKDSKVSDTVIYCREILSKLPEDFMKNKTILDLIGANIGVRNKFAFLNNEGEYAIVNEDQGKWDKGIWYSNDTYSYEPYIPMYANRFGVHSNTSGFYDDWEYYYDEDEPYKISKSKMKKLRRQIQNLTDEELVFMGEYPIYDITNNKIISEYEEPVGQWLYLQEASQELYWDYMDLLDLRGIEVA